MQKAVSNSLRYMIAYIVAAALHSHCYQSNTWQGLRSFLSFNFFLFFLEVGNCDISELRVKPPFISVIVVLLFLEPEKCDIPELCVKEWIWSKCNPYQSPDLVKAEQIGWGVPTIQRLWFGYVLFVKYRTY